MNRETFERLAVEALTEVLDELGYPSKGRGRLCNWFEFPRSARTRDEEEFCMDFADGREGVFPICVRRDLADDLAKAELKRQLIEHGVVPGVDYVRPE